MTCDHVVHVRRTHVDRLERVRTRGGVHDTTHRLELAEIQRENLSELHAILLW